jgi:hypothetical protein
VGKARVDIPTRGRVGIILNIFLKRRIQGRNRQGLLNSSTVHIALYGQFIPIGKARIDPETALLHIPAVIGFTNAVGLLEIIAGKPFDINPSVVLLCHISFAAQNA